MNALRPRAAGTTRAPNFSLRDHRPVPSNAHLDRGRGCGRSTPQLIPRDVVSVEHESATSPTSPVPRRAPLSFSAVDPVAALRVFRGRGRTADRVAVAEHPRPFGTSASSAEAAIRSVGGAWRSDRVERPRRVVRHACRDLISGTSRTEPACPMQGLHELARSDTDRVTPQPPIKFTHHGSSRIPNKDPDDQRTPHTHHAQGRHTV